MIVRARTAGWKNDTDRYADAETVQNMPVRGGCFGMVALGRRTAVELFDKARYICGLFGVQKTEGLPAKES